MSKPRIYKDGNQWCAVGKDFINLQESEAGFGDTPLDAVNALNTQFECPLVFHVFDIEQPST